MKKLSYDEFYSYIWEEGTWLEKIVSTAYLEQNDDFIRSLTFDMFNIYDKADIPAQLMLKHFEIFFWNLFRFEGGNQNVQEIQDDYNHFR